MMEFKVPQKIDVEDKLVGPLTLRQFLKLLVGVGLTYLVYTYLRAIGLPTFLVLFILAPVIAFFGLLTFYKVNEQPFEKFLLSALSFYFKPRKRIWKRIAEKEKPEAKFIPQKPSPPTQKVVRKSQLEELAYILDTKGYLEKKEMPSEVEQMKESLISKRAHEPEGEIASPKGIEELLPPKVKIPPFSQSEKETAENYNKKDKENYEQ